MAGRIAGITVEINGSTTGLEKSLKSVNSTIKNTQSQLKDITGFTFYGSGKYSGSVYGSLGMGWNP